MSGENMIKFQKIAAKTLPYVLVGTMALSNPFYKAHGQEPKPVSQKPLQEQVIKQDIPQNYERNFMLRVATHEFYETDLEILKETEKDLDNYSGTRTDALRKTVQSRITELDKPDWKGFAYAVGLVILVGFAMLIPFLRKVHVTGRQIQSRETEKNEISTTRAAQTAWWSFMGRNPDVTSKYVERVEDKREKISLLISLGFDYGQKDSLEQAREKFLEAEKLIDELEAKGEGCRELRSDLSMAVRNLGIPTLSLRRD